VLQEEPANGPRGLGRSHAPRQPPQLPLVGVPVRPLKRPRVFLTTSACRGAAPARASLSWRRLLEAQSRAGPVGAEAEHRGAGSSAARDLCDRNTTCRGLEEVRLGSARLGSAARSAGRRAPWGGAGPGLAGSAPGAERGLADGQREGDRREATGKSDLTPGATIRCFSHRTLLGRVFWVSPR
jgi:hypothetical protein